MIVSDIEDDDYSACGGDDYARGYIRIIARAVGTDAGPLIREYNTTIADDKGGPVARRKRLRMSWVAVLVLVWVGIAAYDLRAGVPLATRAAPAARVTAATHGHAGQVPAAPKKATPQAVPPARTLTPASAVAFGPSGAGKGDAPQLAPLAIDDNPATAWHTDWYATARFGDLYAGTGLLVDMGRPVTITAAQVTLGPDQGASFELRVGTAPALASLPAVAQAANVAGAVNLPLTQPARGRYVLVWFTSLPRDPAGTFQASVYDIRLEGHA
jgi:Helix-turn-helix domain